MNNNNLLDVHDLERKINELETLIEDLREANHLYQSIFEKMPSGLQIFDAEGFSYKINAAQKEMLGLPDLDTGIGKFNVLNDPYSVATGASEIYRQTYNGVQKSHEFEYDLGLTENKWETRRDKRTFKETIIPIADKHGAIRHVVAVLDDVTEGKLWKESEKKYGKVINSITSGFYFYTLKGDDLIFTGANPAADTIIGISHEKIAGQKIEECFPYLPAHIPELYKSVARGESTRHSFEIEYKESRFSGFYSVDVFRIDQNEIAVNFSDITERKNEEKRQEFLRKTLETLNKKDGWTNSVKTILKELKAFSNFDAVGIRFEKDNDYPYYVQEGFSEEFLKVENSLCSKCTDGSVRVNPDGSPVLECTCGMLLTKDPDPGKDYYTPFGSVWSNYSKDFLDLAPEDEPRINPRNTCVHHGYMSVLLVPLKIRGKKVGVLQMNNKEPGKFSLTDIPFYEEVGSIIGIEYEKTLTEQALRDNEERWKFALEGNQDGVWDWNLENNDVYFSPQWKAMLGYSENEIDNRLDEWSKRVHPDDLEKCYNALEIHIKGNAPFYSSTHRLLCKDGSYKWILDRGKIIKYSDGKPVRMIGTHTDLTERIRLENQLKELISTKDKLFSILGHDLRNPIASIVNFSDLLKMSCAGKSDKALEYLGIINSSADRTLSLLEEILLWAKSQTGQVEFLPELLMIETVFDEVYEMLNPNAVIKKIKIVNSCTPKIVCYADKQMLRTIMRNLVQNAIKFTCPGGFIEVSAHWDNGNVLVKVADNGVGIDIDTQKKLFRAGLNNSSFGTNGEKGSGLGLPICKDFVEKHRGKIWVESEAGKGSTFYFTLPFAV